MTFLHGPDRYRANAIFWPTGEKRDAGCQIQTGQYRLWRRGARKLKCPGGPDSRARADGSHEYAWHCAPFTEGAQYGIEMFYPYQNELHVSKQDGKSIFDGDFGPEPESDLQWPPFRSFGKDITPINSCSI